MRSSCALTPSQKNLVSRDDAGRIIESASRSSGTGRAGVDLIGGPELHDAPHHFGDVLVADLPGDLLRDEEALAQRRPLRAHDVGQLGRDADLLAGAQVPVVGLLAVGRDDADIACVVEQFEDLGQRIVVGARTPPRPIIVHTWIIAGGATMPGWPAALAACSST